MDALVEIFQESIETGEVPMNFKCANVVPIYKKGLHDDAGNYRPVSLTSVVGNFWSLLLGMLFRNIWRIII